jgi:hypothetical protein
MGNLEAALSEEPRPGADRKLSGKEEPLLVATACSSPLEGRARWTLELLADEINHRFHESCRNGGIHLDLSDSYIGRVFREWRWEGHGSVASGD